MWCKNCSRETNNHTCEICGNVAEIDIPVVIYWCNECKTPIIKSLNQIDKEQCTLCGGKTNYMTTDIRPVFPEERLLIEILIAEPLAFKDKSVWASDNRYYVDGEVKLLTAKAYKKHTIDYITGKLEEYKSSNDYVRFDESIRKFVMANSARNNYLFDEASKFIRETSANYPNENIVVSFSGGKDSTVVADLTVRALADPSIVHIFGDTTLEFPLTMEYAKRFREDNPKSIFKTAKNKEQDFYEVCKDIGPPARMMRWCCTMFKTGPITRVLNGL